MFDISDAGETFGPGDVLKVYPDGKVERAAEVVNTMTQDAELEVDERLLLDDFINFGK